LIKILFIRGKEAFLPEIDAYIEYFNNTYEFKAYDSYKLEGDYKTDDFDIIWEFKGFGGIKTNDKILVHEYASLSTGSFPLVKNNMKFIFNPKPNLRIFLNQNVKDGFNFKDEIDYCYRDMGINKNFINAANDKKEYDFVYVGSICKEREMGKFLEKFTKTNPGKLCLIGNVDNEIYSTFKKNKDIIFTGKVAYLEVPQIAAKAEYGINYMPDKYPFNIQTSTKLLEYLALGLKVITTDYKWIREFEMQHNCNFYKFDRNAISFDIKKIESHDYETNFRSEDFLWNRILEESKIYDYLKKYLNRGC
jgi:glycosyltransferase involved in cell wall biosynthesis